VQEFRDVGGRVAGALQQFEDMVVHEGHGAQYGAEVRRREGGIEGLQIHGGTVG
jgi:hypothetical protein